MDLTTATPVEIDTVLAGLYDQSVTHRQAATRAAEWVMSGAEMRFASDKPRYADQRTVGTLEEAIVVVQAQADAGGYRAASAQRLLDNMSEAKALVAANREAQAPLHAEYQRRGGWTRAYLVLASNGHVHSSMNCGTCFPTTAYGWLPTLSGHDEAEIVDAAGADACTVCYPSAPVESLSRPRTVLHHTEEAAAAARAAKAAAKAAKDEAKEAKALLNPVKGPHGRIETLAAAKQTLTDAMAWPTHPYYADGVLIEALAYAIYEKTGEAVDLIVDAAKKRAAKRR